MPERPPSGNSARNAARVGVGILLSRIAGLVRERVFAHYFGNSLAADAFKAALRIPNLLQNLFGEGVLSASFIPVYARLRAQNEQGRAAELASAVAALLSLVVSVLAAAGVLASSWLVDLVAPGFADEKRAATVLLVRIMFPGIGLLVLSAWCLGVLNSHRRFFLSYAAPIVWNLAQIAVLVWGSSRASDYLLAEWLAWGTVLGSFLQFGVQLPSVLGLLRTLRISFRHIGPQLREVGRGFAPVVLARGVVQISAYVDSILASWLPGGTVAALAYAQILYLLPVSLFGMAVSAAELPEMASAVGKPDEIHAELRRRIGAALQRIAFFIVPSSVGFLTLGDVIAAVLFQTGQFTHDDAVRVWMILAGSTVGLLAITFGRLYSSAFYALGQQRMVLRFAIARLALTGALGWLFALLIPHWLGLPPHWGALGLTASAGVAGWVEYALLRRALHVRIGRISLGGGEGGAVFTRRIWLAAGGAAFLAWSLRRGFSASVAGHPLAFGGLVLSTFGITYLGLAWLLGVATARDLGRSLRRRALRGHG